MGRKSLCVPCCIEIKYEKSIRQTTLYFQENSEGKRKWIVFGTVCENNKHIVIHRGYPNTKRYDLTNERNTDDYENESSIIGIQ